jgi:hypothetical protein
VPHLWHCGRRGRRSGAIGLAGRPAGRSRPGRAGLRRRTSAATSTAPDGRNAGAAGRPGRRRR